MGLLGGYHGHCGVADGPTSAFKSAAIFNSGVDSVYCRTDFGDEVNIVGAAVVLSHLKVMTVQLSPQQMVMR